LVKVIIYIEKLLNFSTPVLIIHLWLLKTVLFLHWSQINAVLLGSMKKFKMVHLAEYEHPSKHACVVHGGAWCIRVQ